MEGTWTRRPKGDLVVVFVHGILSSGESCWTHKNGTYWPELLESEKGLEDLGIYVFTYQTNIFSGSYKLADATDALKEIMEIDEVLQSKRLVFVCHSMGGIVARRFLVQNALALAKARIEAGFFLIASPSLGARLADWLNPIARLLGHSQAESLRFIENNEWLEQLDADFFNLKESGQIKIKGKELLEDKFIIIPAFIRNQVVARLEGARYFPNPLKIPGSDHFSIAKPDGRKSLQHRMLCNFLSKVRPDGAGTEGEEAENRPAASSAPTSETTQGSASPEPEAFAVEAKDGTVHFGEEKYVDNGRFTVEVQFYLLTGPNPVTLLGVKGLYFALGCPSLPGISNIRLFVDSTEYQLNLDGTLRAPVRLSPSGRARLIFTHAFRPPLTNMQPFDCDNGDIRMALEWRTDNVPKTRETRFIFRLLNAGIRKMELADSLRAPPRFSDEDLKSLAREGVLSEAELKSLLALDPIHRYMEAHSSNRTSWNDYAASTLLRKLAGNPIAPTL